jgi:lipoprotein signal peptidase
MMTKTFKLTTIAVALIVLLDLILKTFIIQAFKPTEMKEVVSGVLSIGRIQTLRMAFGFQNGVVLTLVTHLVFETFVILLAVRMYKRNVNRFYIIAMIMIIAGWVGNYLDWIFFGSGNIGYVSTSYFWFHFLDPVLSLADTINIAGWVLLFFCIVVFFKDLRLLVSKPGTPQAMSNV